MAYSDIPTLAQAKHYIDTIDFQPIIEKLVKYDGWRVSSAIKICQAYRNFLYINKKYKDEYGMLPPSEEVDYFWHYHILDTNKYEQDCQAIFGYYFHHYPYFGIDAKTNLNDLNSAFNKLQELHFIEFGSYLEKIPIYSLKSFLTTTLAKFKQSSFSL